MFSLFKYTGKIDRIKVINRIETSIMTKEKMKKDARYTIFLDGIKNSKNYPIIGKAYLPYEGVDILDARQFLPARLVDP